MASKPAEYISGSVGPSYRIEGIEETMAMFDDLPKALILAGFTGALNAAADVFLDALELTTPVETGLSPAELDSFAKRAGVEAGDLKSNLMKTDAVLDSGFRGGYIEVGYGKLGYIANFVEYGHAMVTHWGTKTPYLDSKGRERLKKVGGHQDVGFVPAYPFMRPAFDASKERATDAFTESIHSTLENFKAKWGMPLEGALPVARQEAA
jgi:HK97 gp10 family phage protein